MLLGIDGSSSGQGQTPKELRQREKMGHYM